MVPSYQEKSPLLIKETDTINMGTNDNPKNVLISKSLVDEENQNFMSFPQETQINFTWPYTNMPDLDPELVVHNVVVWPDA